jgi:exonuclease I
MRMRMSKNTFKKMQAKAISKKRKKIEKKYGHLKQAKASEETIEKIKNKELKAKRRRERKKTLYPVGFEYKDRQTRM